MKTKYERGSLKRNSSVPPSLFLFLFFYFFVFLWWPQWLFLFNSHLSSLGSFNVCPLWDLFLTLGATLYILQEYRRSFTLYKGTHIKKKCNYHDANVCLCQDSRICIDTSASCSDELACGSSIKQVAC